MNLKLHRIMLPLTIGENFNSTKVSNISTVENSQDSCPTNDILFVFTQLINFLPKILNEIDSYHNNVSTDSTPSLRVNFTKKLKLFYKKIENIDMNRNKINTIVLKDTIEKILEEMELNYPMNNTGVKLWKDFDELKRLVKTL